MPGFVRPLLIVIGALVVIAGALFFFSQSSIPGSPVYPVKQAYEEIRLSLTFAQGAKADWYMTLAERRTAEGAQLGKMGRNKEALAAFAESGRLMGISYKYIEMFFEGSLRDQIINRGEAVRREADELSRKITDDKGER